MLSLLKRRSLRQRIMAITRPACGPGSRFVRSLAFVAMLWLAALPAAYAHLMVAQRGTLNLVGDGAFMVLSLPVSAFAGTDDNGDGKLSAVEFRAHHRDIAAVVERRVRLFDDQGARPLDGLLMSLSPPDDNPMAPASQLVAMGRFKLDELHRPLRFESSLFGTHASEQTLRMTVTRGNQRQLLSLTPDRSQRALFPSSWSVFADYVRLGAMHILEGPDHLLFLLVVLAANWGWRQVLIALTCFTLGHATTLTISIFGGVTLPAGIVEPSIAATIVGMAAFDLYARRRGRSTSSWFRYGLVFACALVHGLGLASALSDFGLDTGSRLETLAGFNVGIELGQMAVAACAAAIAVAIHRLRGDRAVQFMARAASVVAIALGTAWFVQRIVAGA